MRGDVYRLKKARSAQGHEQQGERLAGEDGPHVVLDKAEKRRRCQERNDHQVDRRQGHQMSFGGHLEKGEDRCNRLQVSYPMFRLGLLSSREFVLPCNNITIREGLEWA